MRTDIDSVGIRLAGAVAALAVGGTVARAATLEVPGDYATIQDAVDAAADGDEIVVADGVYAENVEVLDKSLTLRGASDDPGLCVIDGTLTGLRIVGAATDVEVAVRGFTFRDCPIRGVAIETRASASIDNCIVEDCANLGGVFMNAAALTMRDCVVRRNASNSNGAGLWISGGDVKIFRTTFRDNASSGASPFGGGVYVGGDAPLLVADCRFSGNSAIGTTGPGRGGGLGVQGGSLEPITVVDTLFADNEANDRGGAVYVEYRGAVLGNVEVTGNTALAGGGMFFENTGGAPVEFVVANALVADNDATSGSGGGLRLTRDATLLVLNATIFRNTSTTNGGGLANGLDSVATLVNCIVGGHSPDDLAGAGTRVVTYSNVENPVAGEGNISEPPRFVDVDGGDYRLDGISPCIDAGNTAAYLGPPHDPDGNARAVDDPDTANTGIPLVAGAIDMGAYEYQVVDACLLDLAGSGEVDFGDILLILTGWGACP